MTDKAFSENEEGVHLMLDFVSEYTLCGDSIDSCESGAGDLRETEKRTVTCARCVEIIKHARGVRINDT